MIYTFIRPTVGKFQKSWIDDSSYLLHSTFCIKNDLSRCSFNVILIQYVTGPSSSILSTKSF